MHWLPSKGLGMCIAINKWYELKTYVHIRSWGMVAWCGDVGFMCDPRCAVLSTLMI